MRRAIALYVHWGASARKIVKIKVAVRLDITFQPWNALDIQMYVKCEIYLIYLYVIAFI